MAQAPIYDMRDEETSAVEWPAEQYAAAGHATSHTPGAAARHLRCCPDQHHEGEEEGKTLS
jgi:hypothetical protein